MSKTYLSEDKEAEYESEERNQTGNGTREEVWVLSEETILAEDLRPFFRGIRK
jgi:hypothetical protein